MPRRALLSSEQRTRLFAIPVNPAGMARHYVHSTEDLPPPALFRPGGSNPGCLPCLGVGQLLSSLPAVASLLSLASLRTGRKASLRRCVVPVWRPGRRGKAAALTRNAVLGHPRPFWAMGRNQRCGQ
jgi:hypothetical protein